MTCVIGDGYGGKKLSNTSFEEGIGKVHVAIKVSHET